MLSSSGFFEVSMNLDGVKPDVLERSIKQVLETLYDPHVKVEVKFTHEIRKREVPE